MTFSAFDESETRQKTANERKKKNDRLLAHRLVLDKMFFLSKAATCGTAHRTQYRITLHMSPLEPTARTGSKKSKNFKSQLFAQCLDTYMYGHKRCDCICTFVTICVIICNCCTLVLSCLFANGMQMTQHSVYVTSQVKEDVN